MFSPPLYIIRKFTLKQIIKEDFKIQIPYDKRKYYNINQADNMMFRQIRLIKNIGINKKYIPYIIFVDCKGSRKEENELKYILEHGFYVNGVHFILSEKSASMSRNAILGFHDAEISSELEKRITMDIDMKKTVISKYAAYRGLMFSSCFNIENWYPKVIVVDDYERIIPNQHIRYATDKLTEYVDNEGELKTWADKNITEGYADIPIMPFDGCGLHHPSISTEVKDRLSITNENPTSIMWRMPYVKGVTHDFNYTEFFHERGIRTIEDIWGEKHDVNEPMIILTKSMYKGYKYFQENKNYSDWEKYWEKFKKYNHCIGVTKWNYSTDREPVYTRSSYQIVQDLSLNYDDFLELSDESLSWATDIINGDNVKTFCFLGATADNINPRNDYMKAILKNPEMLKDECVRRYLVSLLKKYIDEFKCGKLWMRATFRILTPDLIMLAEYIGGLKPTGVIKTGEFYSRGIDGLCLGEYLIERNPHICSSEHVIVKGTNHPLLEKWCKHLDGIAMISSDSITLQMLNSADTDGDLVLVTNNSTMMKGVNRGRPTVMDMEDKITAPEEEINTQNIIKSVLLSMDNRIGEYSNIATAYHNKSPRSNEQKQKYEDYIDLVSILNGKEIDFAKTGVRFNLPRYISKYAKPLPYFMKYAGDYYKKMRDLSKAKSNLNRLCWDIEKWEKKIRFKYKYKDFDFNIMIDPDVNWDDITYRQIAELYSKFKKFMSETAKTEAMIKDKEVYENYFGDLSKNELANTSVNYKFYYHQYIEAANSICSNYKELANYAVTVCYRDNPKQNKRFAWVIAGQGIVDNIKQQIFKLPIENANGNYEYLGRKYSLINYNGGAIDC